MHEQGIARYRARRRGPIVDSGRPVEVSAVHADGHEFPVELTLGRVEQSDRFLVAIVRDTSDRAAVRTARDLERQRTQFFAMASHEIKTPITALSGNLQLAQRHLRRGDTARAAASLDGAMRHLTQMVRLVDDLLEVSRLDAAKFVIQPARLDLGALVAESIERFDTDDGPTAVALRRPQEPVWVDADAVRLGQVIYNLLHNARKYSAARPVEVHVSHEADDAVIRVTDSGIGIPADERPSLFEPFFRRRIPHSCRAPASACTSAAGSSSCTAGSSTSNRARPTGVPSSCVCRCPEPERSAPEDQAGRPSSGLRRTRRWPPRSGPRQR